MTVNVTTVLIWDIMFIRSLEYQVVANKLRKLGMNATTNRQLQQISTSLPPDSFSQDMIGLIKAHQEIFE